MFEYLNQILSQFTKSQKIIALILLLLLTIIAISLGPSLISTLTIDSGELEYQINEKDKKIRALIEMNDTLDKKIKDNQKNCTNEILNRESNFFTILEGLKKDLNKSCNYKTNNYEIYPDIILLDSVGNICKDSSLYQGYLESTYMIVQTKNYNENIIKKIEKIQSKLKIFQR